MSSESVQFEMVPLPERGRRFTAHRRVRWGDAGADRQLRLDATARYLQDVANDDTRDAGHDPMAPWLVRRTVIHVLEPMALGEMVSLTTFSGGHGRRWAERRTSLRGSDGGRVEVAALWVHVDPVTGRPARLTDEFHATYGEAAGGREVTSRLRHGPPPDGLEGRLWPLRVTDLDGLGHVNNAATWAVVEQEMAAAGVQPQVAELEYPGAIGPNDEVMCRTDFDGSTLRVWLTCDGEVRASALVR
ncbi:MAG: acyl-ACP thioesterase domain-containing protein [Aquihabitans sp.]